MVKLQVKPQLLLRDGWPQCQTGQYVVGRGISKKKERRCWLLLLSLLPPPQAALSKVRCEHATGHGLTTNRPGASPELPTNT